MRVITILAMSACLLAGCVRTTPPVAETSPPPKKEPPQTEAPAPEKKPSPNYDALELERAVHRAVNRVRKKHGQEPLAWNDTLHQVARRHSQDMAERDFFSHTTPNGAGPVERAERLDFPPPELLEDGPRVGVGENLIRSGIYAQRDAKYVAREIVERWLESSKHRRGLLFPLCQQQGLGVAIEEGKLYVTQNFF